MYLFTEVIFYSGQRKYLPKNGYRPMEGLNQVGEGKIISIEIEKCPKCQVGRPECTRGEQIHQGKYM